MSHNSPTETQVKIRALVEKKNEESRGFFAERARLKKKAKLRRKLIKFAKIGIIVLIVAFIVVYFVFLR